MVNRALPAADILDRATWSLVADSVQRLEASWQAGSPANLASVLPASDEPQRLRVLIELVKVDQEFRCEAGQPAWTEAYLAEWPELKSNDETVIELIRSECLTRAIVGAAPTDDEIRGRFPDLMEWIDLPGVLAQAQAEGAATCISAAETPRDRLEQTMSTASAPLAFPIGHMLGGYEIRAKLGQGGMGSVYRAYHPQLDCEVALKIPHFHPLHQREIVERFVREGRALAKVRHPNVCRIYDAGDVEGICFIVMELIEGQSLAQHISGRLIDSREAAEIIRKIALGLAAVHEAGIIHRDVRPHNVMIDSRGEPQLMDFGLAREADRPSDLTSQDAVIGAPAYVSPEQVNGEPTDHRSDIYSLGVTLYHVLTGRAPFTGPLTQVLADVGNADPETPQSLRPELDPRLSAICSKAMAKQPADRYQAAGEVAQALQEWLHAGPQAMLPPRRRSRVLAALAAAFAAVLVGVLIYFKTGSGTVTIDVQDPDAKVTIDGKELTIESREQIVSLAVGSHELEVTQKDKTLETTRFVIRWRGNSLRLVVERPSPSQVATGWGFPRCNLEGTRFYSVSSKKVLEDLTFVESWSERGETALTGDIDGDGALELLVGEGTSLRAYRFARTVDGRATPQLLWQKMAGHLDVVADVTGSNAAEIITSGASGERLILRVFDGSGQQLKELLTDGEIDEEQTKHNNKSLVYAYAVADLEQDGDMEIIAVKTMEGGKKSRGVVVFNYISGKPRSYQAIGPMVSDISVGKISLSGLNLVHATEGPCNHVTGEDGTQDDQCYVYSLDGRLRTAWTRRFDGEGYMSSRVGLADLDGDGNLDIIATSCRRGEPNENDRAEAGDTGELPKDGDPEVGDSGHVYLLDPTSGQTRLGYQHDFDTRVYFVGAADFVGHGKKGILVQAVGANPPSDSLLVLSPAQGLPVLHEFAVPGETLDAFAINDLDGDGLPEIIAVGSVPGENPRKDTMYLLDAQLRQLWRWKPGGLLHAPIVSDLDGNGVNEIILAHDHNITVLTAVIPASP